jgi:hypothetical protein
MSFYFATESDKQLDSDTQTLILITQVSHFSTAPASLQFHSCQGEHYEMGATGFLPEF